MFFSNLDGKMADYKTHLKLKLLHIWWDLLDNEILFVDDGRERCLEDNGHPLEVIQHYQVDHGIVSQAGVIAIVVIGSYLCSVCLRYSMP